MAKTLPKEFMTYIQDLYGRWADESEYEDWKDYVTAAKKVAKQYGVILTGMTQKGKLTYSFIEK